MDGGGISEDRLRTALNSVRTLVAECEGRHDWFMGSARTRSTAPDLFSTASAKEPAPSSVNSRPSLVTDGGATATPPPYTLPTNLPSALRHLDDDQLTRLLAAVIAERQERGGRKLPVADEPLRKQRVKEPTRPLAQGKLNAIRAAFKAGVKPSRIAREFGISHADVKKALASDTSN
jgi:hypothetical protein